MTVLPGFVAHGTHVAVVVEYVPHVHCPVVHFLPLPVCYFRLGQETVRDKDLGRITTFVGTFLALDHVEYVLLLSKFDPLALLTLLDGPGGDALDYIHCQRRLGKTLVASDYAEACAEMALVWLVSSNETRFVSPP